MAYMRISDQKEHARLSAQIARDHREAEKDFVVEQARALRLNNLALTVSLIERAKAAGLDPTALRAIILKTL